MFVTICTLETVTDAANMLHMTVSKLLLLLLLLLSTLLKIILFLSIVHRVVVFWLVQISQQYTPALYQGSAKCSLLLFYYSYYYCCCCH